MEGEGAGPPRGGAVGVGQEAGTQAQTPGPGPRGAEGRPRAGPPQEARPEWDPRFRPPGPTA